MRIAELEAKLNHVLSIVADDGRIGRCDVSPSLEYEAFDPLHEPSEFAKIVNGGVFHRVGVWRGLVGGHH